MKARDTPPLDDFEQRLLAELREFVEARAGAQATSGVPSAGSVRGRRNDGHRRSPLHRRRILSASAALIAAATVAVVLALGATTSTPPAYAVTHNPNGTVTVTIRQLTGSGIAAINAKFRQMGITETAIPIKAGCKTPGIILPYAGATLSESLTFSPSDNKHVKAPYTAGVLAAEQLPNGKVGLTVGAVKPPVPSCFSNVPLNLGPIPAPARQGS